MADDRVTVNFTVENKAGPMLLQAGADVIRVGLEARGYEVIDEYRGIRAGHRVRHVGDLYPAAMQDGTADVVYILERRSKNPEPDIEFVVITTRTGDPRAAAWASYATVAVQ